MKIILAIMKKIIIKIMIYINYLTSGVKKTNNKEKNILIIISRLNTGGAERAAIYIAEELSKKYPVKILIYNERRDYDYDCNIPVIEANKYKKTQFQFFYLIKEVRKIKKENQITHTISFCSKANLVNVMSKRNDKTIISIRNYLSNSKENDNYRPYNNDTCKLADKIVCVSSLVEEDAVKNYGAKEGKTQIIYNFIEKEKLENKLKEEIPNEIKILKSDNIIISVGRLHYQKAQWHLIKAFELVTHKIPNAKLIILGNGELKEKLKQLIVKLNLQNSVYLLGFQTNPYKYMKCSKAFILSSYYEGMSNVILEAMACELPVIASDCKAGNREILAPNTDIHFETKVMKKEEYGIIVPVCYEESEQITVEEKEMAKAMIEVLENKSLQKRYSEKSKERVKDFAKEKSIEMWIKIIENV